MPHSVPPHAYKACNEMIGVSKGIQHAPLQAATFLFFVLDETS